MKFLTLDTFIAYTSEVSQEKNPYIKYKYV